jgi:hypothetical protein
MASSSFLLKVGKDLGKSLLPQCVTDSEEFLVTGCHSRFFRGAIRAGCIRPSM